MGKVLALLGVVAAAALGWALWPSAPTGGAPSSASSKPAAGEAAPAAPAEQARPARVPKAPNPAEGVAVVPAVPDPSVAPPSAAPAEATPARPLPVAPGAGQFAEGGPARPHDSPLPKARFGDVKASVKRFYGSLPASGKVPQPLYVEDVLPPGLIAGFNLPPRTTVKMVAHFPSTDAQGLKSILEMGDQGAQAVGFTFVTPDGREIRDYAFLEP